MFDNSARKTFTFVTIEDYEHYISFIYNIIAVSEQRMYYSQIIHDHPNKHKSLILSSVSKKVIAIDFYLMSKTLRVF